MATARPRDTDPVAWEAQFERIRALSIAERLELVEQLWADTDALARASIRRENPGIDEQGMLHELARRRYGIRLADEAFGASARS